MNTYILIYIFSFTGVTPAYHYQGASGGSAQMEKFQSLEACQFAANTYLNIPFKMNHIHDDRVKRYAKCYKLPGESNESH